jgi:anti-sigma regulatory factor (Ser/Thr protein kinase)
MLGDCTVCRVAKAEFGPELSSAMLARHWVAQQLRRWELNALLEVATLLTSELVTNAVIHAADGPAVSVAVAKGDVEVGVTDSEARLPRPPAGVGNEEKEFADFLAEEGRGLVLVERLAAEWGVKSLVSGKHVWFRLKAPDWSHESECRCDHAAPGHVMLESGRMAEHIRGPWDEARVPPAA